MPTKSGIILPGEGLSGNKEQWGFSQSGSSLRRVPGAVLVDSDSFDPIQVGGYNQDITYSGSVGIGVAATWQLVGSWAVPAGKRFHISKFMSSAATAGSATAVVYGSVSLKYNLSNNVYVHNPYGTMPTPLGAGNRYYRHLLPVVSIGLSALAVTVTPTYTNEAGATAQVLQSAISLPASAPARHVPASWINNSYSTGAPFSTTPSYGILQGTDSGITDITSAVKSAAPTGVLDMCGVNMVGFHRNPASDTEITQYHPGANWVGPGEIVMLLINAAAVTAQQRDIIVTGFLTDVPA